jgi:hypothetical protein
VEGLEVVQRAEEVVKGAVEEQVVLVEERALDHLDPGWPLCH